MKYYDEKASARIFNFCESWHGTPRRKDEEIKEAEERRRQEISVSLAEFKSAEQAFFNSVQPIYFELAEKILDSQPNTEAGMVLKLLFKKIKNGSYYSENVGLIPALTHLLVFFMNERDGLSLQAAGGSDEPDDRWLHIEKIFNNLKLYGFNREQLGNLDQGSVKRSSRRRFEKQERTQPSSNDLLILSANNHPFFQFWLKRKPSAALDEHTLKLYQYCASYWLNLEERLVLTQEIKKTDKHLPKDREDLDKLNSFWQREARKIEVQLLDRELEEPEDDFKSVALSRKPLAEAINRFYTRLTQYLLAKEDEITFYCSEHKKDVHPLLEKILSELTKKHMTFLEKFEFIETCNYLGLESKAKPVERSSHFYKSKHEEAVKKYASITPVKSIFIVISSLNFQTQKDFIHSLNLNANMVHPNDIYRYLFKVIPHLDPLLSKEPLLPEDQFIYDELEKVKSYCNDGESGLIPSEIKIPRGTTKTGQESLSKLQIYWQQQRLLHHIKLKENTTGFLLENIAMTINEFYNHFSKLIPQFKKDLQNWEVAKICRKRETVTDKYNFIIELYYLGKLNQDKNQNTNYDSLIFSNITILIAHVAEFEDVGNFLSSIRHHVTPYVANPNSTYTQFRGQV